MVKCMVPKQTKVCNDNFLNNNNFETKLASAKRKYEFKETFKIIERAERKM